MFMDSTGKIFQSYMAQIVKGTQTIDGKEYSEKKIVVSPMILREIKCACCGGCCNGNWTIDYIPGEPRPEQDCEPRERELVKQSILQEIRECLDAVATTTTRKPDSVRRTMPVRFLAILNAFVSSVSRIKFSLELTHTGALGSSNAMTVEGDPVVSLVSRMKSIAKMFSDASPVSRPGLTTTVFRPMLMKLSLQSRRWHWTKNLPSSSIHQIP